MANRSAYDTSYNTYTSMVANAPKFQEELSKKLQEKNQYNQDLLAQEAKLKEAMYSMPSASRAELIKGPIVNPLEQEAVIQKRLAGTQGQLGFNTNLLNARGQQFSDILKSAMNQYNTQQEAQRLSAESAWRTYQDELQQEEANKNRALQAQLASMAYAQSQPQPQPQPNAPEPTAPVTEVPSGIDQLGKNVGVLVRDAARQQRADFENMPVLGGAYKGFYNSPFYQEPVKWAKGFFGL